MKRFLQSLAGWAILGIIMALVVFSGVEVIGASRICVRVVFLVPLLLGIYLFNSLVKGAREDLRRNGRR